MNSFLGTGEVRAESIQRIVRALGLLQENSAAIRSHLLAHGLDTSGFATTSLAANRQELTGYSAEVTAILAYCAARDCDVPSLRMDEAAAIAGYLQNSGGADVCATR